MVVPAEAPMKKERPDETLLTTKIIGLFEFHPSQMLMYFLAGLFLISPHV
jgi:hypothetical protein